MDKRLAKRHKREVARAKERVKVSEPDVRTPEEIKAAREASKPPAGRGGASNASDAAMSFRGRRSPATTSAAKTDA
jgi:hypothetical protein